MSVLSLHSSGWEKVESRCFHCCGRGCVADMGSMSGWQSPGHIGPIYRTTSDNILFSTSWRSSRRHLIVSSAQMAAPPHEMSFSPGSADQLWLCVLFPAIRKNQEGTAARNLKALFFTYASITKVKRFTKHGLSSFPLLEPTWHPIRQANTAAGSPTQPLFQGSAECLPPAPLQEFGSRPCAMYRGETNNISLVLLHLPQQLQFLPFQRGGIPLPLNQTAMPGDSTPHPHLCLPPSLQSTQFWCLSLWVAASCSYLGLCSAGPSGSRPSYQLLTSELQEGAPGFLFWVKCCSSFLADSLWCVKRPFLYFLFNQSINQVIYSPL